MYKTMYLEEHYKRLLYTVAITQIPGIGVRTARKIIARFGNAEVFFKDTGKSKKAEPKFAAADLKQALIWAEREIEQTVKHNISAIDMLDPSFPHRLNACEDSPLVLYYKGALDFNTRRNIAVVGTRKASSYGQRCVESIMQTLKTFDCTLISGLALGIDTAAHKSAEQLGIQNIGVLAHGLDRIYPYENKNLATKMALNGGILSEFPIGTKPEKNNFPMRNRIIAGLADAVVVVEAGTSGGALITANIASSYHRDVFAFPGRISDDRSSGCNRLIRSHKAAILSHADDLAFYMGWDVPTKKTQEHLQFVVLNDDEKRVIQLIKEGKSHIDQMLQQIILQHYQLSALLLGLEFKNIIKPMPGNVWCLCDAPH
jgi:DNA processing protein